MTMLSQFTAHDVATLVIGPQEHVAVHDNLPNAYYRATLSVVCEDGTATIRMYTKDDKPFKIQHEVTADLLDALEDMAEGCSLPGTDVQRAVRDRARAAIAKATGVTDA